MPGTLKLDGAVDGVLISHPHQDHFGLLGGIPSHWPVYCGEATAKLMTITADIMGKHIGTKLGSWYSGRPMVIGAFTVTPYLIDHSAFDAYMLLIDIAISMKAKTMVPVHGTAWDSGTEGFPHISRLTDGQPLVVCSPKP